MAEDSTHWWLASLGRFRTELRPDFGVDDVAGILPQATDVALERSIGIVRLKPRIHLPVGQPLQLPILDTHRSSLRKPAAPLRSRETALTDNG